MTTEESIDRACNGTSLSLASKDPGVVHRSSIKATLQDELGWDLHEDTRASKVPKSSHSELQHPLVEKPSRSHHTTIETVVNKEYLPKPASAFEEREIPGPGFAPHPSPSCRSSFHRHTSSYHCGLGGHGIAAEGPSSEEAREDDPAHILRENFGHDPDFHWPRRNWTSEYLCSHCAGCFGGEFHEPTTEM
jgi:hypothetical protein